MGPIDSLTKRKRPKPAPPALQVPVLVTRDRRTLELRQFYVLPRPDDAALSYGLDVYLFFAPGFGLTPQTWDQSGFYRDAQLFMRLHAPALSMHDLSRLDVPNNPIDLLRQRLPMLLHDSAPSGASLTALAQMFGAELTDALYREVWWLRQKIKALANVQDVSDVHQAVHDVVHSISHFCRDSLQSMAVLQRMRVEAQAYQGIAHPSLLPSLAFAEEYSCAMLDEGLSTLAHEIDHATRMRDGTGAAVRSRLMIAHMLEQLNHRRRAQGFALPSTDAGEYYTYRIGLIKKELQRALYVNTRSLQRDPFYANSAAMVAAGLAATWATLAQIPLLTGRWNEKEGMILFAAAVGAYVLKDRIKEWVRNRLSRRWIQWDHDHKIMGDALRHVGLGAFTGRARERMRWLEDADVPEGISTLRSSERTVRGVSTELEQVLHYRRILTFEPAGTSPLPRGYGIQEILRLSLDDILRRLDDPKDEVAYYDEVSGKFAQTALPKVYHLNVVHVATDLQSGQQILSRARVVLNQKRLLRIEPVASRENQISQLAIKAMMK